MIEKTLSSSCCNDALPLIQQSSFTISIKSWHSTSLPYSLWMTLNDWKYLPVIRICTIIIHFCLTLQKASYIFLHKKRQSNACSVLPVFSSFCKHNVQENQPTTFMLILSEERHCFNTYNDRHSIQQHSWTIISNLHLKRFDWRFLGHHMIIFSIQHILLEYGLIFVVCNKY
jgi:hypothetical protein